MTQAAAVKPLPKSAWIFNPYLQLFVGGICDATGELLLKYGADAAERFVNASQGATGFLGFLVHTPGISGLLSTWTWLGIIAYILGLLLWLSVLRTIPLNIAFPIVSVLHLGAPIGARYLLHEPVPGRRWIGIVLALLGIMLLVKPVAKAEESL